MQSLDMSPGRHAAIAELPLPSAVTEAVAVAAITIPLCRTRFISMSRRLENDASDFVVADGFDGASRFLRIELVNPKDSVVTRSS